MYCLRGRITLLGRGASVRVRVVVAMLFGSVSAFEKRPIVYT
jgi:hypothetical protein